MSEQTITDRLGSMIRAAEAISKDPQGKTGTMQAFEAGYIMGMKKSLNLIKVHAGLTDGIKSS
jgi:hypothetical protein